MPENNSVFRKKTLERISTPEQLTDYLHVTNPGIWWTLAAVVILLVGLYVWAVVATLESVATVTVKIDDETAYVVADERVSLETGMTVFTDTADFVISYIDHDEYGRVIGVANVDLPNGSYEGRVVVETMHPIEFLFSSNG